MEKKSHTFIIFGNSIQTQVNYRYRSGHHFFFASNKFYFPVSNLYLLLNSEVYFFHLPHSIHWLPFFLYLRLASPLIFAFWSPYPKIIPCLILGKEHLMMSCKFGTTQRYSAQGEGALCLTVCVPWCKCLCPKGGLSLICTKGSVSQWQPIPTSFNHFNNFHSVFISTPQGVLSKDSNNCLVSRYKWPLFYLLFYPDIDNGTTDHP